MSLAGWHPMTSKLAHRYFYPVIDGFVKVRAQVAFVPRPYPQIHGLVPAIAHQFAARSEDVGWSDDCPDLGLWQLPGPHLHHHPT